RAARPPAEAQELGPRAVILDGHEQPGRAERPATDLQVPAVVVATAPNRGAGGPEVRFETPKSLVGILPALAPEGEGPRAGQPEAWPPPPPPGRQAIVEPATQARQRLEQVERCRQQPPLDPRCTAGWRLVERRTGRAQGGLRQRWEDDPGEQR